VKPHEIDVLAFTVFGNFQKIEDAKEPGGDGQLVRNVLKPDGFDRIHFDLPVIVDRVPSADFYMRAHPYPDTARDFTVPDARA
jgi:hypothetical protein